MFEVVERAPGAWIRHTGGYQSVAYRSVAQAIGQRGDMSFTARLDRLVYTLWLPSEAQLLVVCLNYIESMVQSENGIL